MKIKLLTTAIVLITYFLAFSQKNPKTEEEIQQNMINYSFDNADYIFEAHMIASQSYVKYQKDSSGIDDCIYYTLNITKIYRGGKDLRLGTIVFLAVTQKHYPYGASEGTAIYFAKKSDLPIPFLKTKIDNNVYIKQINILGFGQDEVGNNCYRGFGSMYHSNMKVKTYYDIDNELFKNRKNITIPKSLPAVKQKQEKHRSSISKVEPVKKWIDTTGIGAKKVAEYEVQRNMADENMLQLLEIKVYSDTTSLATFQKHYDYLNRYFYKSAAYFKKRYIDNYQPIKKKALNSRTISTTVTPLASGVGVQYGIRNKTLTTVSGKNYYEFDVTINTTSSVYEGLANLFFTTNPAIFGNTPMSSGKIVVTKGATFSNIANKYSVFTFDGMNNGYFDVQLSGSPVVIGPPSTYNRVSLSANVETILFHIKIEYNPSVLTCGQSPNVDFYAKSAIETYSFFSNSATVSEVINYTPTTYVLDAEIKIAPSCPPTITGIDHHGTIINAVRGGTEDFITIKGAGFGDSRGLGKVKFKNANTGGVIGKIPVYVEADDVDITRWTDTEIDVKVPSVAKISDLPAGTGTIKLVNNLGDSINSIQVVTVLYSIDNVRNGLYKSRINYVRQKCVNGIEFVLHSSIQSNTAAIAAIEQAILDWNTELGSSYKISLKKSGGLYVFDNSSNVYSNDGVNIISYGSYRPDKTGLMITGLASNTLGTSITTQGYYTNADIIIRPDGYILSVEEGNVNWNYSLSGAIIDGKYDFYGAFLHELGHTLGLNHIIGSQSNLMHYATDKNPTPRKFLATDIATSATADIISVSKNITWYPQLGTTSIGTLGGTTPTPVIYSNYPTPTVCGLSAQLNSSPNLNTYQWRNNGVNIPTNLGGTTAYYNLSTAGKYDLIGSLNGCTVVSNVVTITQIGKPVLNTNVAYSAVPYCIGTMSVTSNSSNTYKWYYPNNAIYYLSAAGAFTGQTGTSFVAALADIQLPWRVDATNCAGTSTTYIPVNAKTGYVPSVSIAESLVISNGICNYASNLTANVVNGATSYQWYRNDNNAWVTQTGWNTQTLLGNYQNIRKDYKVDVSNACGIATSSTIRLKTICAGCSAYVPASNCPNGLRESMEDSTKTAISGMQTLKLYPNPATTELSIESENEINEVEIINTSGIAVTKKSFSNQKIVSVDISSLSEGVYVCKIYSNNEILVKKVVVAK